MNIVYLGAPITVNLSVGQTIAINTTGTVTVECVSGLGLTAGATIGSIHGSATYGPFSAVGVARITATVRDGAYEVSDGQPIPIDTVLASSGQTVLDDASRSALASSGFLSSTREVARRFKASRATTVVLNALRALGDSYAGGAGADVPSTGGFPALIAAKKGYLFSATGATSVPGNTVGAYVVNVTESDYMANINDNDVFYGMFALNDTRTYDMTNDAYLAFNKLAQAAVMAFVAVPRRFRMPIRDPLNRSNGNPQLTFTGTWTHNGAADGRRSYGTFASSATVGATPTWAWDTLYIIACAATGSTGSFTVEVGGTAVAKYYTTSPYAQAVGNWEPFLIAVKVPKGVQSFRLVCNSDTMNLMDIMPFDSTTVDGPMLIAAGHANLTDTNWAVVSTVGSYTNVKPNDPAISTGAGAWSATWKPASLYGSGGAKRMWQATRDVVEWLQRDGLNVVYHDVTRNLDINNHFAGGNVHPNDAGHQAIASEFVGVLNLLG